MYQMDTGWEAFYEEMDPEKRKKILEEKCSGNAGDVLPQKIFWENRCRDRKNPERSIDLYLWECVNLVYLYKKAKFFRRSAGREVLQILSDMGCGGSREDSVSDQSAFYWEMRNAVKRYFSTGQSKNYRRRIFGILGSDEEERKSQICQDAWQMSEGVALRTGLSGEMRVLTDAVRDEYAAMDPGAAERFSALSRKMQKRA